MPPPDRLWSAGQQQQRGAHSTQSDIRAGRERRAGSEARAATPPALPLQVHYPATTLSPTVQSTAVVNTTHRHFCNRNTDHRVSFVLNILVAQWPTERCSYQTTCRRGGLTEERGGAGAAPTPPPRHMVCSCHTPGSPQLAGQTKPAAGIQGWMDRSNMQNTV